MTAAQSAHLLNRYWPRKLKGKDMAIDIYERLGSLAIMARNMKKLDPQNFAREPISGFIDALAADLDNIASEWLEEDDQ
jgi:hypothetical protein